MNNVAASKFGSKYMQQGIIFPCKDNHSLFLPSLFQSVLRNAATSFKTMPSIIRKRCLKTCSAQGSNASFSDSRSQENRDSLDVSPSKIQKRGNDDAMKCVEKRLESAFDNVFDKLNRSDEGGDASGANS
ncbi:hypothetical protein RHSIM_Rhsim07G0019800 [Rhododendron simsii]|uniref:Uncharacterized protein n=1 Tax=Rhododendron simsii TaxID=118357 RepID=A0A834GS54_RHOSS|nr:hypothetical protein RHSIM_Rhsim07G0019800 [Rhododendron simsii]